MPNEKEINELKNDIEQLKDVDVTELIKEINESNCRYEKNRKQV